MRPRLKHVLLGLAGVLGLALIFGGYHFYHYVETNPRFCASCHIMEKAWTTWQAGPHKALNCKSCHQQTVQDRVRIVWRWATKNVENVSSHTRLNRSVCEGCHLNEKSQWKQVSQTAGHDIHVSRANLECLSCHLPSLHATKPKVEDCVKCHAAASTNIGQMSGFHCTACHQFLVPKAASLEPKRELCLGCHAGMAVKGETFPSNAPMQFDCAACHKPHSQPILQFNDCLGCHAQIAEDQRHFERKALTNCVNCHRPHSWKAVVPRG